MNEQLRLLIDLQKLDTRILAIKAAIERIPDKISTEEGPLKEATAANDAAKQRQASLEKKKREKELAIEDLNEKIKKLKQRTSELKTNKEYQAHLKEIEKVESDIRTVEDEILVIMESLEESSRHLAAEQTRLAEEKKKIDAMKEELQKEVRKGEEELRGLMDERKKLSDTIDPDAYTLYMNTLKVTRGLAVVEAKNEICQGCYLHIPPQMFVELKKNDEITQCPQCRRILFYKRSEEATQE